jgi:hypothetical protein
MKTRGRFRFARVAVLAGAAVSASAVLVAQVQDGLEGLTTVMGHALNTTHLLGTTFFVRAIGATYCDYGLTGSEGGAPLQLPPGAALLRMDYWAYDTHATRDLTIDVYESCQSPGVGGEPVARLLGGGKTAGAGGSYYGEAVLDGTLVDNSRCHYSLRVVFAPLGTVCVQAALQLQKARVYWVQQVSPAPAAASFNDVPASHPFFQFIEALSKSGITGGCGAGVFCPDQPLTRGQMAVFLAKGLGLAWP